MEDKKTPPGNRVSRVAFSFITHQFSDGKIVQQVERREYVLGLDASGEDVLSLWCEIANEYMTVTKVVAPFGSQTDLLKAGQDIIEWVRTTGPRRKIKTGASKSSPEELEAAECVEADEILSRMWNHVESMEHKRVIYKISEITGPIEWTAYLSRAGMPERLKSSCDGASKIKSKKPAGKNGP
ncbi:hypothetical protein [Pseudomonas azotoformans]|uniref:hypothetical protein n=1 Tax=Pseudomonas azotoformans TaxID=47878 RepID=UPI00087C0C8A|nr:hypothetical protein [Pseudomonas azotoformans]SDN99232.1 hypothetical protein SAMN04489799_3391 [Pseudomonas azotoformans]